MLDLALDLWPRIYASDLLRYLVAAGGLAAVLAFARGRWQRWLVDRRIQPRTPGLADRGREVVGSLATVVIFSLVGTALALGGASGALSIYDGAAPTWRLIGELVVLILAHDAYFYWLHRAMHRRVLFRVAHHFHHRSRTPTPWAAYAFAPLEALLEAAFLPLLALLMPLHELVLFAFTSHMIVRNVLGHAGVELFPRGWLDSPWTSWITTTTHHDLHHACGRWNYGLYFRFWDRLCGTEHPDYEARFRRHSTAAQPGSRSGRAMPTVLVLAALALPGPAEGSSPGDVDGLWVTAGFGAVVRLSVEERALTGTLEWLWDPQGVAPDRAAQARIAMLADVLWQDDAWEGGTLYNPEDGRRYRVRLRSESDDRLLLRGCWGPICRTQLWRRLESLPGPPGRCSDAPPAAKAWARSHRVR